MVPTVLLLILRIVSGIGFFDVNMALVPCSFAYMEEPVPIVSILHGSESIESRPFAPNVSQAVSATQKKAPQDIQWFKEKMKISPKYMERREGILGMSWGHFFTMVFLLLFAAGALLIFFLRYRRTKEILNMIKEEARDGSKG